MWGEGLDQLEPTVNLYPQVRAAFAVGSPLVLIKGVDVSGSFRLTTDYVELSLTGTGLQLVAYRYLIYEFQGWEPGA